MSLKCPKYGLHLTQGTGEFYRIRFPGTSLIWLKINMKLTEFSSKKARRPLETNVGVRRCRRRMRDVTQTVCTRVDADTYGRRPRWAASDDLPQGTAHKRPRRPVTNRRPAQPRWTAHSHAAALGRMELARRRSITIVPTSRTWATRTCSPIWPSTGCGALGTYPLLSPRFLLFSKPSYLLLLLHFDDF